MASGTSTARLIRLRSASAASGRISGADSDPLSKKYLPVRPVERVAVGVPPAREAGRRLPCLDPVPEYRIDDQQLRHRHLLPLGAVVEPRPACRSASP